MVKNGIWLDGTERSLKESSKPHHGGVKTAMNSRILHKKESKIGRKEPGDRRQLALGSHTNLNNWGLWELGASTIIPACNNVNQTRNIPVKASRVGDCGTLTDLPMMPG